MPTLGRDTLLEMGFASIGDDVQVSSHASFYGVSRIALGNRVRIDDFCVLSAGEGGIVVGNHVHIAVGVTLIGKGKIAVGDFVNLSSRVAIYSSNDDYSGAAMTGPMVPAQFTNYHIADVAVGRHVIVGSGSVILPGVTLEDGVAIGALSLVNRDCAAFGIYAGSPVRRIKDRRRDLLELERQFHAGRAS